MALGAVALALGGCTPANAADDNFAYSAADDPALVAAEDEALTHLPRFWQLYDVKPIGYSDFVLKVGLPTADGRGDEFIWMTVLERLPEGDIVGELANEPVEIADLRAGSTIQVSPSRVIDWSYTVGGKAYGHFTTRALFPRMSPATRAEVEATLSPTPLETDAN